MEHSVYIGKLNEDETEELLRDVLNYVTNDRLSVALTEELDPEDLEELTTQLNAYIGAKKARYAHMETTAKAGSDEPRLSGRVSRGGVRAHTGPPLQSGG